MIPFLHFGPIEVPTFGLMVAMAMLGAYYVLRADMARRGIAPKDSSTAEMFIAVPSLAGIAGAKLYHVLETPRELFADPIGQLFSRYGLAWFGGLIAGFAAFLVLARMFKIPVLEMMDAGSPAAALGYGIGRIGCLLSGDGDYGVPTSLPWGMSFPNGLVPTSDRVHPTPIYEFLAACAIAWILWRIGSRQIAKGQISNGNGVEERLTKSQRAKAQDAKRAAARATGDVAVAGLTASSGRQLPLQKRPSISHATDWRSQGQAGDFGMVFAAYLLLTGLARFLVEFIRINPRSFLGISNAQAASVASMIAGAALAMWLRRARCAAIKIWM